jgi:uncharacterized protein (TIGR03546 family)
MLGSILGPLRTAMSLLMGGGSTRAVAFGFAMGMMIGLMPKDNLTAVAISTLVLATQANLASAAVAGGLFTWAAMWTDPLAHRLGSAILAQPSCQTLLARLYEWPVVPWTAINNTVVAGSLVLSLVLFYPAYHLVWLLFDRYQARIAQKLRECHAEQVLAGAEVAARWSSSSPPGKSGGK